MWQVNWSSTLWLSRCFRRSADDLALDTTTGVTVSHALTNSVAKSVLGYLTQWQSQSWATYLGGKVSLGLPNSVAKTVMGYLTQWQSLPWAT